MLLLFPLALLGLEARQLLGSQPLNGINHRLITQSGNQPQLFMGRFPNAQHIVYFVFRILITSQSDQQIKTQVHLAASEVCNQMPQDAWKTKDRFIIQEVSSRELAWRKIVDKKMLAARFYAPMDVRLEEIEVPQPGPGEVLVRVGAATTCGTDLKTYRRGHPLLIKHPPSPFGHEVAGTIVEVGTQVAGWRPGARVVVANSAPCNRCFFCRRGQQSLCEDLLLLNGAYADYLLVPARIVEQNLWELPTNIPFTSAALTEPLACALHGIEESDIHPGESVVIIGAGPLGLLLLAVARLKGARVIVCGRNPEKLAVARALGADEIVDMTQMPEHSNQIAAVRALTEAQRGADVVIEAVGVPELWEAAVRMVRRGGLVNFFGGCASGTAISLETQPLHYDEITLKGVFHHTPAYFSTALHLIASGRIPVERLITDTLPLQELPRAFDRLLAHQGIKYALLPEGSGA